MKNFMYSAVKFTANVIPVPFLFFIIFDQFNEIFYINVSLIDFLFPTNGIIYFSRSTG